MAPDSAEGVVRQSVFEGMFVHVLKVPPDGSLADALRGVGFDLRRQQPDYPSRVWKEAMAIACRDQHPKLPREEAMRKLGRSFIEGFLLTLAGRALGVILPMLGPEAAIRRLPRFLTMGAPGMQVSVTEQAPQDWRIAVQVPFALADFDAGLIEAGLGRTGAGVQVTVMERNDDRYLLAARW